MLVVGKFLGFSFLAWVDVERFKGGFSSIISFALFSIWFNFIRFTVVFVSSILPFFGFSLNYLGSFPINFSVLICFFWSWWTCSMRIYLFKSYLFLASILFIRSGSFSKSLIVSSALLAENESSLSVSSANLDKTYLIESFYWGSVGSRWQLNKEIFTKHLKIPWQIPS